MFETPNMKIVKMNEKHVKSIPSTNKTFLDDAMYKLNQSIIEADKKLINDS